MSPQDPYHIPGTEPVEPQQPAEHPDVAERSKRALALSQWAVGVALLATCGTIAAGVFAYGQWKAADRQADIADRALRLAEQSAKDQSGDIERSRRAAENSASAASQLAESNASMALTTRNQLEASNRQLGVMQRQLEATDRPWIQVMGVKRARFIFMGPDFKTKMGIVNTGWANISLEIKNIGRSVATQVRVRSILILPLWKNGYSDVVRAEQNKFCNSLLEANKSEAEADTVLFPNDSYDAGNGSGVSLTNEHLNLQAGANPFVVAAVVGCVDYRFRSSSEYHQTRFVYELFHSDTRTRFFEIGQDVATDGLLLIRNSAADWAN